VGLKELFINVIVKMLTSTTLTFFIVFVAVFIAGLLAYLLLSLGGGPKEFDLSPLLLVSLSLAFTAAGLRIVVMKRYSWVKI
jgi:hypothetical protein